MNKFLITVRNKIDGQFIQMFLCSQGILSALRDASYTYKQQAREMYRIALSGDYINKFYDCIGVIQNTKLKEARSNQRYKNILLDNSFRIKVESIEQTKNTVYDINVPISHSFICNSMINHNTGRFSSSDPNLQNIPSHNKDIRPMFMGTQYKNIEDIDNKFHFLRCDIIETCQGNKLSQDLKIGDDIICDDGNYKITNIEYQNNNIYVTI